MKIKTIAVALIIPLLIFSCKSKNKGAALTVKPPVVVEVVIAGAEEVASNLEVNGTVLANEMVELHPEVSGRLIYLNMPDGAFVKAGTILAKVNDADLQAQLEQQRIQLELATKTESRLSNLLKVNGVNQADYDVALSQMNTFQANIKVLNAQLDKTVVRAPFAGELGLRVVSPGAYVSAQTILGTLQQTDKVKIDFTVPETYASAINIGDPVKVQTNESAEIREAKISAIETRRVSNWLLSLTRQERSNLGYMHPGRVDVISAGSLVLAEIIEATGLESFTASENDILDGMVWSMLNA